jgi:hypothetical protein
MVMWSSAAARVIYRLVWIRFSPLLPRQFMRPSNWPWCVLRACPRLPSLAETAGDFPPGRRAARAGPAGQTDDDDRAAPRPCACHGPVALREPHRGRTAPHRTTALHSQGRPGGARAARTPRQRTSQVAGRGGASQHGGQPTPRHPGCLLRGQPRRSAGAAALVGLDLSS